LPGLLDYISKTQDSCSHNFIKISPDIYTIEAQMLLGTKTINICYKTTIELFNWLKILHSPKQWRLFSKGKTLE